MPNFTARILNNAAGALTAQQAVIATIGNNIANVNSAGYTRRVVDLQNRAALGSGGQLAVGDGVEIGRIEQVNDKFLNQLVLDASSDSGAASAKNKMLDRLQQMFALDGSQSTIGDNLTAFFTAADDLASNPSSIELRSNFIAKATDLVDSIHSTYDSIAALQTEADRRISADIDTANTYLQQIGELNGRIAAKESGGGAALDERDQRQVILNKLAEKMNYNIVENDDGSDSITLPSGFTLVSGTDVKTIGTTPAPSFVGTTPPSLSGSTLNYIVYDFSNGAGTQHIDLTQQITGGSIGGLLALRGYAAPSNTSAFQATGTLVETASRVEAIARNLLTVVNSTYLGPVDRNGATPIWDPSSGDLNGANPSVFGLFSFNGAPGATATGKPTVADLNTFLATNPGFSFANQISLTTTDPRKIAAAIDASGGAPAAAVYPVGDGQNIKSIANLQNTIFDNSIYGFGSYGFKGTLSESYNETITKVGNDKARAELDDKVSSGNLETAQNKRDEVSGVSLDEEFTKLIMFQKAYQAAARMIKTGQDLLDEILRVI